MELICAIEDEQDVTSWLDRHPGARTVIRKAPGAVAEFFPDADLRLEVRTDSESAVDERLGMYVRTGMDPESAVEQLVSFDSEWGDRLHSLTEGDLLFNIEAKVLLSVSSTVCPTEEPPPEDQLPEDGA
jgi:hypothetical protein